MGCGREPGWSLTAAERRELQQRIRDGETFEAAAAAVGGASQAVQRLLGRTGGVKPRTKAPPAPGLSLAEREEISRGLLAAESCRVICGAPEAQCVAGVAGRGGEWGATPRSGVAGRRAGRPVRATSKARATGALSAAAAGSGAAARPAPGAATDRPPAPGRLSP